jgi:hypothetical protein
MFRSVPRYRQLRVNEQSFRTGAILGEDIMVNIIAEGFTQRIDRFFIERFELRKRLFWGQPGGFLIHDVLLVSALLTFCLVCHRLKKAQDNLTRLVEKVLRLEPVDAGDVD